MRKHIQIFDSEKFKLDIHEMVGLKLKKKGVKKPIKEIISGDELFIKENRWVKKERVIDRNNNRYYENIKDPITDEVIHECNEPLSEHFAHGSAKKP